MQSKLFSDLLVIVDIDETQMSPQLEMCMSRSWAVNDPSISIFSHGSI